VTPLAPYREVLAYPEIRRLLPGFAASALGSAMSAIAVAWLAVQLAGPHHAGPLVGMAGAAYGLPGIVAGFGLGRFFRRYEPRTLMIADSLLRAGALGAIPAAQAIGVLTPALYVGLLAVSSLLSVWGSAGRFTLVAALPAELRRTGNALLNSTAQGALVAGPALAGLLTQLAGPATVIGVSAASYALLAASAWRVPARGRPAPVDGSGLRALLGRPRLAALLALTFVFYLLYGPVEVAVPVRIAADLHRSAGTYGACWTLFAIGALVGGLATGVARRLPLWPVAIGVVLGWGLIMLPMGLVTWVPLMVALFAVGGLVYAPYEPLVATLIQEETPPALVAPVAAAWGSSLLLATPVGMALGGPLVGAFGASGTLVGSAVATLALGLAAAPLLLRRS